MFDTGKLANGSKRITRVNLAKGPDLPIVTSFSYRKDTTENYQTKIVIGQPASFLTHNDLVLGKLQVLGGDGSVPFRRGPYGGLVDQVRQVRPCKSCEDTPLCHYAIRLREQTRLAYGLAVASLCSGTAYANVLG